MRVITGTARGRRLISPRGDKTRPTTDKMKETVFNVIQFQIEGARMLDLFAGSGQMGIEALSRGASSCTFVEKSNQAYSVIEENLELTHFEDRAVLSKMDVLPFLATTRDTYDLAFADPPYDLHVMGKVLEGVSPHLSEGGLFLCETREKEDLPEEIGDLFKYRVYKGGKSQIVSYRKGEPQ